MRQLTLLDLPETKPEKKPERKPWVDFTPPSADRIYDVLSYGGGRQTFYILVAIEKGLLPKPDLVIFADTQDENIQTYQHIEQVAIPLCERLGIEFVSVSRGSIYDYHFERKIVMMPPRCTDKFKIQVINNYLVKRFNLKPGIHAVNKWIGISTDESHRADSVSEVAYTKTVFPLIGLGKSRTDCIEETKAAGYQVPVKSGCDTCPHITEKGWRIIKRDDPKRFEHGLKLELKAQERDPASHLPMYGRASLRIINFQDTLDSLVVANLENHIDDLNCVSGVCFV